MPWQTPPGVLLLRGAVRSGLGDFGRWSASLQDFYRAKTGLPLFPGTLNLELERPAPFG